MCGPQQNTQNKAVVEIVSVGKQIGQRGRSGLGYMKYRPTHVPSGAEPACGCRREATALLTPSRNTRHIQHGTKGLDPSISAPNPRGQSIFSEESNRLVMDLAVDQRKVFTWKGEH